jgi:hypothetical protein
VPATIAYIGHKMQAKCFKHNNLQAQHGADCGRGARAGNGPRHAQAIDHPGLGVSFPWCPYAVACSGVPSPKFFGKFFAG